MARAKRDLLAEQARQLLQEAGLRRTHSREIVLAALLTASQPLTHGDLVEALASHRLEQATIYRNLTDLVEAGLATRFDVGDHVWRFELRMRPGHADPLHPHFVCEDCGEVTCLPEVSVNIRSTRGKKRPAINEVHEVLIKGRCDDCS